MATTQTRTLENFIAGDWVASTGESSREIVSPVTGETLAHAPNASADDVERATRAARAAQPGWAALSAWDRATICHAIAEPPRWQKRNPTIRAYESLRLVRTARNGRA